MTDDISDLLGDDDQTGKVAEIQRAAAEAIDVGRPLYLATCHADVETLRHWGQIAAFLPEGTRGTEIAKAIDGVPALRLVRDPQSCSRGRVLHYFNTVRRYCSNLRVTGNLLMLEAPTRTGGVPSDLDEPEGGAAWAESEGLTLDDLVEASPAVDHDRLWLSGELGNAFAHMNEQIACVMVGGKFLIASEVKGTDGISRPRFMDVGAARNLFLAHTYVDEEGKKRQTFDAWLRSENRKLYPHTIFEPKPPTLRAADTCVAGARAMLKRTEPYNLFRGWRFRPDPEGDWHLFEQHWRDNIAGGDDNVFAWLFAWAAHLVQMPHKKPGTAVVLRGEQGSGKTLWTEVLGRLLHPEHYVLLEKQEQLIGKFNASLGKTLLVGVEEAVWAGDPKSASALKHLVTSKTINIELKGVDPIQVDNYSRLVFTSNAQWVVPAGLHERRFACFDVGKGWLQDRAAFEEMLRQLDHGGYERLLYDLATADLRDYPDPCVIPATSALVDQKLLSADTVVRWWHSVLEEAASDAADWEREVPCDALYHRYYNAVQTQGIKGKVVPKPEFGRRLKELVPQIDRRKYREHGVRENKYILPPLADARSAFDDFLAGK